MTQQFDWVLLLRILLGGVLGGVIGYERDVHGKPAGLRTHMVVALAASTFMVVSTRFALFQGYVRDDLVSTDPSRIAASIVTGIGFLAGGAILRNGLSVQGLTTAAGLWLVAAIGMAAGGGMYVVSAFVTLLGVLALTILTRFEDKDILQRRLSMVLEWDVPLEALTARLKDLGATLRSVQYDRDVIAKQVSATFDLHVPQSVGIEKIVASLETEKGLKRLKVDANG
ncbi:MAG: MgtC/SapB family protein [Myxococcaceae bacterium]